MWRLVDAAPTIEDGNLVLVAAFAGLRQGELLALRWTSVYIGTDGPPYLIVRERLYQGQLDEPKSRSGRRKVILDPESVHALRKQTASARPNPNAIVFPSIEGSYIDSSNWHERVWEPTRKRAGVQELHFHDLRAFYVTTARGIDGLTSAETKQLVGHADQRTHDDCTYGTPEIEARIVGRLAGVFTRPTDDQASST